MSFLAIVITVLSYANPDLSAWPGARRVSEAADRGVGVLSVSLSVDINAALCACERTPRPSPAHQLSPLTL